MGKIQCGTVVAQSVPSTLPLLMNPHILETDQAEVVSQEVFPFPSLNGVKPFHASFVCHNLSAMARQGLCSQVTCTAALPAALPGQNTFMGHRHGWGSAGLAGVCSSTSIRFLFKSTPAYFLLLLPKKIKYALI